MKTYSDHSKGTRLLAIILCAMLIAGSIHVPAHAASAPFDGSGTEDAPYLIKSVDDWNKLADIINDNTFGVYNAADYADRYYKLDADIGSESGPVTKSIGKAGFSSTQDKAFSGHFDGAGHTIFVSLSEIAGDNRGTAPFRVIYGAEIKNLTVEGTVSGKINVAGLVGYAKGSGNRVEGCVINAAVASVYRGNTPASGSAGGVIGDSGASELTVKNTAFCGTLSSESDAYAGGLVGICNEGASLTLDNCLFTGTYNGSNFAGFHPVAVRAGSASITVSASKVLYSAEPGLTDASLIVPGGSQVYTTAPSGMACLTVTGTDGNTYFYPFDALSGSGSENNPFLLSSNEDWSIFAAKVNEGFEYFAGAYYAMTADIGSSGSPVTDIVGVLGENEAENKPFSGHLDGGGHTLYVNIDDSENQGAAPFRIIKDAEIMNLTVEGTVKGGKHTAGLAGFSTGTGDSLIEKCVVKATASYRSGTLQIGFVGGIVGNALSSAISIIDTVFCGTLQAQAEGRTGGIIGWCESGASITLDNCMYIGHCQSSKANYHPVALRAQSADITVSVNKVFYTEDPSLTDTSRIAADGYRVYSDKPEDKVYQTVIGADGRTYYRTVNVSGVLDAYEYTGNPISVNCVLTDMYGNVLEEGRDYVIILSSGEVRELGDHDLVLQGTGEYQGSQVLHFIVLRYAPTPLTSSLTSWEDGSSYYASEDITIDGRITVNGTVRLIVKEGKTVTAKQGITVSTGNTLIIEPAEEGRPAGTLIAGTIEENVTIGIFHHVLDYVGPCGELWLSDTARRLSSYPDPYTAELPVDSSGRYKDYGEETPEYVARYIFESFSTVPDNCAGIGAAADSGCGNIIINGGKINAIGGSNAAGIGGPGGYVTLGWSDRSDFIESAGYEGTIIFADGKSFGYEDGTIVIPESIGQGKILPRADLRQINVTVSGGKSLNADQQDQSGVLHGELVTMTGTGGLNYSASITVTGADGSNIPLTRTGIDTYTFIMPDCDVDVNAVFTPIELLSIRGTDYIPFSARPGLPFLPSGYYAVDADMTVSNRVVVDGDVQLFICEGAELICEQGITVLEGSSLTIDGSGILTADSADSWRNAAIGGDEEHWNCGTVRILGGTVNAYSNSHGSGIGGAYAGKGGNVMISGGQVTATSNSGYALGGGAVISGTVSLGWTNNSDFIMLHGAMGAVGGTLSFADEKAFIRSDPFEIAYEDNINGAKIVPYTGELYTVTMATDGNGSLDANTRIAAIGQPVTIIWSPADAGYTLDTITAEDESGTALMLAFGGNRTFTFIMPAGNVSVTATFKSVSGFNKTASNTGLGTGTIANPVTRYERQYEYKEDGSLNNIVDRHWAEWNYVYFGSQGRIISKFRVLDKSSGDFGVEGGSLLLDCDRVLVPTIYQNYDDLDLTHYMQIWNNSLAYKAMNDTILSMYFTEGERNAISPSYKAQKAADDGPGWDGSVFQPLTGEKLFALDNGEAHRPSYGYIGDNGKYTPYHGESREKYGTASDIYAWWLRSPYIQSVDDGNGIIKHYYYALAIGGDGLQTIPLDSSDKYFRGCVVGTSPDEPIVFSSTVGVSPAMNIALSNILFSTDVTTGEDRVYKLTVKDSSLSAEVTSGQSVTRDGNTITVPYTLQGSPNRLSLLVTDGDYQDTSAKILLYEALKMDDIDASGSVSFTLSDALLSPENRIYLIAEVENSWNRTDYASEPLWIAVPGATALPEFKSHTLVLSGQIGVNFYVDLSMLSDAEKQDVTMEFTIGGKTQTDSFDPDFTNPGGDGYYGFTCYINSVQMADEITAVLKFVGENTVSQTYSAAQYVSYINSHAASYSANTVALVNAIADYGHYVQPFLAANNNWTVGTEHVEMAAHSSFSSSDIEAVRAAVAEKTVSRSEGSSSVESLTYSLNLETETSIRIYFRVADDYAGEVDARSNNCGLTLEKQPDGRYRIEISGISAHELGDTYHVTVAAGGSFVISVSALSYVNTVLNSQAAVFNNEAAHNAAAALYKYYAATVAYQADPNS